MKFIIAEIGSNHESTLNSCANAIGYAKAVGADAVKFQLVLSDDLYGPHDQQEYKGSIKPDWLPQLKEKANACDIEFMCSAFSPKGYEMVDHYVLRHKLASPENNHVDILHKLKELGRPVIMSCGASHPSDLRKAVEILGNIDLSLLYCVSAYPCDQVKLEKIQALKALFPNRKIGLSDHTRDYACAPVEAFRHYGCEILEKHFNPMELDSPDACVSIGREEFKTMVDRIKKPVEYDYLPEKNEKEALLKYNRRIIALKDIPKDSYFKKEDVGFYRVKEEDAKGLSPFSLETLLTRPAKENFKAGDIITL